MIIEACVIVFAVAYHKEIRNVLDKYVVTPARKVIKQAYKE